MVPFSLALAIGWLGGAARAQELNYQTYVVGERALGMGGAFTGVANDPSAAFYNPAGIAFLHSGALSGSLSVSAINDYVIDDAYAVPTGTADFAHDADPTIPLFAGFVKKFGKRDPDQVRPHAFALCTFHPISYHRAYAASLQDPTTAVDRAIFVTQSDTVTWYGPSYALRFSPSFALGVSGFLATRSFHHEEHETIVTVGARGPSGFFQNETLSVRDAVTELSATGLVFRLGALWDPMPNVRLGVTVQPPGIELEASSRVYERRIFADIRATPPDSLFFTSDQGDLPGESPTPWELRLGASYAFDDLVLFAADVSIVGGIGSEADRVNAIGLPTADPLSGATPQLGTFVADEWWSHPVVNAAFGVDTVIADYFPTRVGFFTNFSAAPDITGPTGVFAPPDVDTFGVTGSVGLRTDGYDVSIGAAYLLGSGTALGLNADFTAGMYTPRPVEVQTLYFFLSGTQQAMGKLSKEVYDDLFEQQ